MVNVWLSNTLVNVMHARLRSMQVHMYVMYPLQYVIEQSLNRPRFAKNTALF